MSNKFLVLIALFCFFGCSKAQTQTNNVSPNNPTISAETIEKIDNKAKIIHVMVALCDNENQGIVPVPAFLGNGEDPQKIFTGARRLA